jgi:hypothetical protein
MPRIDSTVAVCRCGAFPRCGYEWGPRRSEGNEGSFLFQFVTPKAIQAVCGIYLCNLIISLRGPVKYAYSIGMNQYIGGNHAMSHTYWRALAVYVASIGDSTGRVANIEPSVCG